jgi:hypothetical protein
MATQEFVDEQGFDALQRAARGAESITGVDGTSISIEALVANPPPPPANR